jgi:hypothetical protein
MANNTNEIIFDYRKYIGKYYSAKFPATAFTFRNMAFPKTEYYKVLSCTSTGGFKMGCPDGLISNFSITLFKLYSFKEITEDEFNLQKIK